MTPPGIDCRKQLGANPPVNYSYTATPELCVSDKCAGTAKTYCSGVRRAGSFFFQITRELSKLPIILSVTLLASCATSGKPSESLLGGYSSDVVYVTQLPLFLAEEDTFPKKRYVLTSSTKRGSECATRLLSPSSEGKLLPTGSRIKILRAQSYKIKAIMFGTGEGVLIYGRTNVRGFPKEIDVTDLSVRNNCENNGLQPFHFSPDPALIIPEPEISSPK